MEPKIIKGHLYRCKKNVIGGSHKYYYKVGKIYECECESYYPDESWKDGDRKHSCGYITSEFGNKSHAWPYDPKHHLWCHDKWTDFFEDLGEKPTGMIISPYGIGDTVSWFCYDDYSVHKTKILSMEIEVVKDREPLITYKTRIKHKGIMSDAWFELRHIREAQNH